MEDYELGVSSATIRNEMAHLERGGYITRRHPSAGSVPCDKGYRYYVESLTNIELPLAEQRLISHLFHQVEKELEQWLCLAATLISRLVQNVAVVTMPRPGNCRFKHMEVLALQDSLALIVLVLRGARVKQQLITLDRVISQAELTAITGRLNITYSGLTESQIVANTLELSAIEQQLKDCLLKMMQTEDEQEFDEPRLDGLHFILNQPEFANNHRLLTLMELIEHRNLLQAIVPPELPQQGVQVVIGKENRTEVIQDYSVVIGRYGLSEEAVGTIGIVGPTRMPYARAISTIGYLSSLLSELVAELYGREKPTGWTNTG
jgi:heat-inducible transcriptional repressor